MSLTFIYRGTTPQPQAQPWDTHLAVPRGLGFACARGRASARRAAVPRGQLGDSVDEPGEQLRGAPGGLRLRGRLPREGEGGLRAQQGRNKPLKPEQSRRGLIRDEEGLNQGSLPPYPHPLIERKGISLFGFQKEGKGPETVSRRSWDGSEIWMVFLRMSTKRSGKNQSPAD